MGLSGMFVLFVLLVPVSCSESFFTEPIICYFLDAFLMVYCIIFTALFFKEKFSTMPPVHLPEDAVIYQELERPVDADPYQVLEPSKRRKRAGKKKHLENQTQENNMDPYESLIARVPPPLPQSLH